MDYLAYFKRRSIENEQGCWIWQGALLADGYGQMGYKTRSSMQVHRAVHLELIGPILDGNVVMHTCDRRSCCNPAHLKQGTQAENIRDMHARSRYDSKNIWGNANTPKAPRRKER
jgi:phospholipase C